MLTVIMYFIVQTGSLSVGDSFVNIDPLLLKSATELATLLRYTPIGISYYHGCGITYARVRVLYDMMI